ncbi:dolichyl-diphosphooligosaccharide--protein glycosyltransferase subunit 2-like protein [Dinothrombium tinctorium]|uniref:Dolichyl-diphosphooligosaccharide--protein glycosyltransferase subunit 2 n=1 Tax=Dinothrombium tinctorium TaxID=1965070 RepID=A0A3S3NYU5_9ACAR|nr:dolichyl-diphosphooligosaccharide--protein glycosyltransferase subunit 2-like protein [Dinothrombium tinctorium]RWS01384.1 dolichyl-diphosphooligosaccharide--protein glycosyltransferase subunit 2-like protein [Dinothrombium tinctorium]RWS01385.1 dolichyl-diphosphooligosaccharide--protein glycosyltransferase subunit 2-like protein [Dinothrombium tinctorium]
MTRKAAFFAFLLNCCVYFAHSSLTPNTFLEDEDRLRLLSLFQLNPPFAASDVVKIHYSLIGSLILKNNDLNSVLPSKDKADLCTLCDGILTNVEQLNVENAYFASSIVKLIGCKTPNSPKLISVLNAYLKEGSTVAELHRAANSLLNIGQSLDSPKLSKILQTALKNDESLLSTGLAFQLASNLKGAENLQPFVEKISDVVVQADEIDGRLLQFEGGLGITANIILGIYSFATAANKPIGLTNDQSIKFTNYFLSRKTVQTPKSAAELLQVLKLLVDNKYHIPVCVSRYQSPAISHSNPVISVRVANVMGKSLGRDLKVTANSELTGKKNFQSVQGDSTLFALKIDNKARRGAYNISIDVTPSKADPRLIGNTNAVVKVIMMTEISIENVEIGVVDSDQVTSSKLTELKYPSSITQVLEADYQQKLILKFVLRDKIAGDTMTAHQAFVLFVNEESKQEIVFVAEPDTSKPEIVYKFDLNLNTRSKDFSHISGRYQISLIIGDFVVSNPFVWKLGSVKLTFPASREATQAEKAPWMKTHYSMKPEIKHMFRQQEKRPPAIVSDTFSVLVCVPFLILLGLWAKLGINLKNIPICLSVVIFHVGLGSIFALFACFWLKLNMFTTIKYLLGLGLITFLSGHSLLSRLASKRAEQK